MAILRLGAAAAAGRTLKEISMIVRIFIGVGLFTLGYLGGKGNGPWTQSCIRDQLRWVVGGR